MKPKASTKVPFSYHRTATRKRGRTVHRIYAQTPRPPITGVCLWWAVSPTNPILTNMIAFSKDGNDWWTNTGVTHADFITLKTAALQGALWNALFWKPHFATAIDWNAITGAGGAPVTVQGKGIGPCPYLVDDSFSF